MGGSILVRVWTAHLKQARSRRAFAVCQSIGRPESSHLFSLPAHPFSDQGTIDQKRRDYAGAFAAASHPAVLAQLRARNESLLLVGSKKNASMPVPPEVEPYVRVVSSLRYAVRGRTVLCHAALRRTVPSRRRPTRGPATSGISARRQCCLLTRVLMCWAAVFWARILPASLLQNAVLLQRGGAPIPGQRLSCTAFSCRSGTPQDYYDTLSRCRVILTAFGSGAGGPPQLLALFVAVLHCQPVRVASLPSLALPK